MSLIERLTIAIEITKANMLDELDERNESRYWEGYRDALVEVREKLRSTLIKEAA